MGRQPIGKQAMTAAERQKARRERLKAQGLEARYVNPDFEGEYFSVQHRLAQAVKTLLAQGQISNQLCEILVNTALDVTSPKNRIDYLFIKKEIINYLNVEDKDDA